MGEFWEALCELGRSLAGLAGAIASLFNALLPVLIVGAAVWIVLGWITS